MKMALHIATNRSSRQFLMGNRSLEQAAFLPHSKRNLWQSSNSEARADKMSNTTAGETPALRQFSPHEQTPPVTNQHWVTGEFLKKFNSMVPTLVCPELEGCVPSDTKSASTQVRPSERGVVPFAHR